MNRVGYRTACLVCGMDMQAGRRWAHTTEQRLAYVRQMLNGICDPCQILRFAAAMEFIRASDDVRLLNSVGARWTTVGGVPPAHNSPFVRMLDRVKTAESRCVELKMWPMHMGSKRPPWFYGDYERSTTA